MQWLKDFINTCWTYLQDVFSWSLDALLEILKYVFGNILDGFLSVIESLLSTIDFSSVIFTHVAEWSSMPTQLIWLINQLAIPQGLTFIVGALTIRVLLNLIPHLGHKGLIMTITCFAGTPGSGKSYEAVQRVIDNLQKGRVIYTNIEGLDDPLCHEAIKSVANLSDLALTRQLKWLEPDQLDNFWNHIEPRCMVVLDEIHKVFGSRDWQTEKNKNFGFWASTHRHQGIEAIMITQNPERIDSAVRSLFEWTYVFRKVNFFGGAVQKKYLCYSYPGDDTNGKPLAVNTRTYDSRIFPCYKSYDSKEIKEQGIMQHVNVLKHPVFYAIPIVLVFTLYMVFSKSSIGTGDVFGSKKVMARYEKSKQPSQSKNPVPGAPTPEGFTPHTPNISRIVDASGKTIFSNRKHESKADEKPTA